MEKQPRKPSQKKANSEIKMGSKAIKSLYLSKINDCINQVKKIDDKKEKNKNNYINSIDNKKRETHKKVKTQINLNALTSNFNFINEKRRKNNKSLFNFGNIYFINQNQIIEKDQKKKEQDKWKKKEEENQKWNKIN